MSRTSSEAAEAEARAAAEAAARHSYGKLVAYLAARSRDVAGAEDALSDAFAAALAQWPRDGVPAKPEAWLMSVARRRGIDAVRRRQTTVEARAHLVLIAEEAEAMQASQDDIPDERLRLMFACAHPAIEPGIRAPLILQTLLGFDAAAIASAFLVQPSTMAQRLVRAKARIKEAGIPLRVPDRDQREEIGERLDAVLEAIYAAYAEGWGDPAGIDSRRRNLATEAIWLGRLAAGLMPEEAEAESLVALMLFAEARRPARRDSAGRYVPLGEQDMSLWDTEMILEAETRLRRAGRLEGPGGKLGRYQLEAAVQAVHAARRLTGRTDWAALVTLYDALATLGGSPVVTINRAVAIAETVGPQAALAELDAIADDRRLVEYQPYWAARAGILARVGEAAAAREAYERAIGLERDPAVRAFLQERKAALAH